MACMSRKGGVGLFARLEIGVYGFQMRAVEDIILPEYKGGVLRGAFGTQFKKIACLTGSAMGPGRASSALCSDCAGGQVCPYKAVFEPSPPEGSQRLRNLQDIPRPFVLRVPADPRTHLKPGESLEWEVVLVGDAIRYLPYFVITFKSLGEAGFGERIDGRRGRADLEGVYSLDPFSGNSARVYDGKENLFTNTGHLPLTGQYLDELTVGRTGDRTTLNYVSITRLKYRDRYVRVPEFHVLVRNLLRRFSTLSYFYQGEEVEADFNGLIARAEQVTHENISIQWKEWQRYSGRTRTAMDFDGFTGRIRYAGALAEYMPLLFYGSLVNAGKGATFGLGQYLVEV